MIIEKSLFIPPYNTNTSIEVPKWLTATLKFAQATLAEQGVTVVYKSFGNAEDLRMSSVATKHNLPSWVTDIFSKGKQIRRNMNGNAGQPTMATDIIYFNVNNEHNGVIYCNTNSYQFNIGFGECSAIKNNIASYVVSQQYSSDNNFNEQHNLPFGYANTNVSLKLVKNASSFYMCMNDNRAFNLTNSFCMGYVHEEKNNATYLIQGGLYDGIPTIDGLPNTVKLYTPGSIYDCFSVNGDLINGNKWGIYDVHIGVPLGGYLGKLKDIIYLSFKGIRGNVINVNGKTYMALSIDVMNGVGLGEIDGGYYIPCS